MSSTNVWSVILTPTLNVVRTLICQMRKLRLRQVQPSLSGPKPGLFQQLLLGSGDPWIPGCKGGKGRWADRASTVPGHCDQGMWGLWGPDGLGGGTWGRTAHTCVLAWAVAR